MSIARKIEDLLFSLLFASVPFLLLLGLLLFTTSSMALDVEQELERTDQILADFEARLPDNPPNAVLEQLGVAYDLQDDAWQAFENEELILAKQMTMQARGIVQNAERILVAVAVPIDIGPPEDVLRQLEQNAELIEELAPLVDEFGNEVSRANFAAEVDRQNGAWTALEQEQYEIAGRLAESVHDNLLQIRNILVSAQIRFGPERVAAEIERASDILNRAGEKIAEGTDESHTLLENAYEIFHDAETAMEESHSQEAMRFVEEVIVLAQRAVQLANRRGPQSAKVLEIIARTDEVIESAEEAVEQTSRQEAAEMLSRACELQIQAKSAIDANETDQAERYTLEARRIAELSVRTAQESSEIRRDEVERAIAHTDDLIAELTTGIEESGSGAARELLDRAGQLQADAISYLDRGKLKEALTSTRAASETIRRAAKVAGIE